MPCLAQPRYESRDGGPLNRSGPEQGNPCPMKVLVCGCCFMSTGFLVSPSAAIAPSECGVFIQRSDKSLRDQNKVWPQLLPSSSARHSQAQGSLSWLSPPCLRPAFQEQHIVCVCVCGGGGGGTAPAQNFHAVCQPVPTCGSLTGEHLQIQAPTCGLPAVHGAKPWCMEGWGLCSWPDLL